MAEGISVEELQLAARNHGMPLEALRWDITPVGLHYLLIHYDIPVIDPESWRLEVGGHVERPLTLSLADIRARPFPAHSIVTATSTAVRARISASESVWGRSTWPPTSSLHDSGSMTGMS